MIIFRSLPAAICLLAFLAFPLVAAPIVRPALTLTNLKSGQLLSNDTFTVQGSAAGSAGISNVLFSLNNGGWDGAESDNLWTNWSADLTLIPGTNILTACAVDNHGVRSLTNTVKFAYYVTAVLTVRTNGNGSISPADNGLQLMLGATYAMKATSTVGTKTGYGFRNWTDGSNNIITNGATVKFMMASNLTLVANFGDIKLPSVSVVSTTTNADSYPADYIVHGTASDNVAVTNVYFQLNTGGWHTVLTTNQWTNWTTSVELLPGANTFSAYAVDSSGNVSPTTIVNVTYNSAPLSLAGQQAVVTVNSTNNPAPFTIALGKNIFTQFASDTNNPNAVGSYTYLALSGSANLKFKYLGPPSAASAGSQTLGVTFITPTYAIFTNTTTKSSGTMQFSSISNLAPPKLSGQLLWIIGSGGGDGVLFQKSTFSSRSLLATNTNTGSYTCVQYSPVGSLLKLTGTNSTTYVLARFAGTNFGSYYEEDYSTSHTNTDKGNFLVASQMPGGNAPLTITNRNFEIFSGNDSFNDQFGAPTYSQGTLSSNFDNAVGSYTFARPDTNLGQLNLTITEPPTLAGSNSAARLMFVSGNTGIFTNDDRTFSSFVMTPAAQLAPASLTNTTLSVGTFYNVQFATNGGFVYNAFFSSYSGTYTYTPYSPGGAMVQLTYLDASNNIYGLDWLQLNFSATNSGNIDWNQFDASTNSLNDPYSGPFSLY
jgi:hypothetical protein